MKNTVALKMVFKLLGAFLLMVFLESWMMSTTLAETLNPEKLQLVVGKSLILKSAKPVKRVSIAAPEVADFILLSPSEIYLTGKSSGVTNLTLWQNHKIVALYELEVNFDISRLKQNLHAILPDERDIQVFATHDSITLTGRISSATKLTQAVALAEAYMPECKNKVRNLLEVGGVHQVMLEVRVAEMQRNLTRKLGVNFNYIRGADFFVNALGGLSSLDSITEAGISGVFSDAVNMFFRFQKGSATWTGFIDALKEDGLVKVLAEPTLIALSGQTATFLAGGEFPIPVPQENDTITIDYKPFGVGLHFTPTVLSENKISIQVAPDVSEVDFSTAAQFAGYIVPGITTRRASTTVELADGQSFAIAGLLRETVRDAISKFPLLGDIPILGTLFRSHQFQKSETELVIIATPHLVKPMDSTQKQTLPTNFYVEPNDTEFYLLGLMEGDVEKRAVMDRVDLDGDFGHGLPNPN